MFHLCTETYTARSISVVGDIPVIANLPALLPQWQVFQFKVQIIQMLPGSSEVFLFFV
jgi:hypothetical protein